MCGRRCGRARGEKVVPRWEDAADCECPQAGVEPLHPPAAGRGHLRHGREVLVMQVRVLRVSSVVSSTSIHFLTAGEDGEADHNRKTEPSSTLSPRSRICDKESEDRGHQQDERRRRGRHHWRWHRHRPAFLFCLGIKLIFVLKLYLSSNLFVLFKK